MGCNRCSNTNLIRNNNFMAKVTITIDDTNPAIVAMFGANSLNTIADSMGYTDMVEKTIDELPAKVDIQTTDPDGNPITIQDYPVGTEMFKPNPLTKGEYVAGVILKKHIVPALLASFEKQQTAAALAQVETAIEQAKTAVANAAEVIVA